MTRRRTLSKELSRFNPHAVGRAPRPLPQGGGTAGGSNGLALARPAMTEPDARKEAQNDDRSDDTDLASVYRRHGAQVSRWAARLAGPGFDIEDLVHDVFLVVQRRLVEFRGEAQLTTWLYQITVRVVQARRRRLRRQRWLWPFGAPSDAAGDREHDVPDQRGSPLEILERRQASRMLYRFLEELDEKYRTAVVLFEIEGLPCPEIAVITGTSVPNVWTRISRGREMLVQAFAKSEAKITR